MFVWSVAFNTRFLGYFETDAVKTKHKYHGRWDCSLQAFPAVEMCSNQNFTTYPRHGYVFMHVKGKLLSHSGILVLPKTI